MVTELPAMLTPGIASAYEAGAKRLVEAGARIVGQASGGTTSARIFEIAGDEFASGDLSNEVFGPSTLVVRYVSNGQLESLIETLEGQLTATVHSNEDDDAAVWKLLSRRAGRVLFGGYPTGVEVNHAMVHGGPWPATTDGATTSVGTRAIRRFARLVAYQNAPERLLPPELRDQNPRGIWRLVDGEYVR